MEPSRAQELGGGRTKKHRGGGGRGQKHAARPAAGPATPLDMPLPQGGVEIDGSMLEGGGQILRNASALSAILRLPIQVRKIRAGRDKPGLRPQHLAGLQLIAELCSGRLQGGEVNSTCITLFPGRLACGTHLADTKTAGSCMLLAQSALPCLLFSEPSGTAAAAVAAAAAAGGSGGAGPGAGPADSTTAETAAAEAAAGTVPAAEAAAAAAAAAVVPAAEAAAAAAGGVGPQAERLPAEGEGDGVAALQAAVQRGLASFLDLKGGTDAAMAPPAGYMQHVLLPVLRERLGVEADMRLERRGFFPRGGGHVALTVRPLPAGTCLPPLDLTQRGEIVGIAVRAFTAGRLVPTIGGRMADAAQREIKARMPRCGLSRQTPLTVEVVHEPPERAFGDGCGILVAAQSSTGCLFGATGLGERGVPAETIGARAAGELMDALASGACTDEWLQDQLIIFMALAKGHSRMLTGEPTLHTRTACMVAQALTEAKFRITQQPQPTGVTGESGLWMIECEGAAVPAPGG